jgi:hypothetical protein
MLANGFSKTGATPDALELEGKRGRVAAFDFPKWGKIRGPQEFP